MRVVVFDARLMVDRLAALRALDRARPYLSWTATAALLLAFAVAPRARHAVLGAGVALIVGAALVRITVHREALRIEALVESAFSASEESASAFTGCLFDPLSTWVGYLSLTGLGLVVGDAALIVSERIAHSRYRAS